MKNFDVPFPVLGINNLSARLRIPENFCANATDCDFGKGWIARRPGETPVVAVDRGHSLWAGASAALFGNADQVSVIESVDPFSTSVLRTGLSGNRISYAELDHTIFWSNGTQSGKTDATKADFPWALPAPSSPSISTVAGSLFSGAYRIALRYDNDGWMSPASPIVSFTLPADGGIRVTLPVPPAGVTSAKVYCTDVNGSTLFHVATVAANAASVDVSLSVQGRQLGDDAFLSEQPAGSVIAMLNGRLLSAVGQWLTFSAAYYPGLYNPLRDAIRFEDEITMLAPCETGVFVGTESRTYWLAGADIAQAVMFEKLPYGAASGSVFLHPATKSVGWYGDNGVVLGLPDGSVSVPQEGKFAPPVSAVCATVVVERDGEFFVLCNVDDAAVYPSSVADDFIALVSGGDNASSSMNLETGATSRYTGFYFNSMATIGGVPYGMNNDGVFALGGEAREDGSFVDFSVDFGALSLGTPALKNLQSAYITGSGETTPYVGIELGDESSYEYPARAALSGNGTVRVDLGRGLRDTVFGVRLFASDGGRCKLTSLTFAFGESGRRI